MRRLGLLLAAVVAVLLPACGDDGGGTTQLDALTLLSSASDVAQEAGAARVAISLDTEGAGGVAMDAEGLVEFEARRVALTMALPDVAGLSLGDIELVLDSGTLYFHLGEMQELMGVDTEWMSMDVDRLAELQGVDLGQLQAGASTDPTQVLELLQGASDDIEVVGTDDVRGEETTHYRATVDLRKAAEQQGLDVEETDELLDRFGGETMPMDVWIDDAGRARRMRFSGSTPAGDEELRADVTVELYDYGTEDRVEVPTPDDVTDVTEQLVDVSEALTDD